MSDKTKRYVIILQSIYLFIFFAFLINALMVDVLFAPPALAILRVPSNIRGIGDVINAAWTQNLRFYHLMLLIFTVLGSINLLGLSSLNSKAWRGVLRISSFLGILILWSAVIFFMLPFLLEGKYGNQYLQTSIVYALVTFGILLVNLATFAVAIQNPLTYKKR
jgi:hypothetical protein